MIGRQILVTLPFFYDTNTDLGEPRPLRALAAYIQSSENNSFNETWACKARALDPTLKGKCKPYLDAAFYLIKKRSFYYYYFKDSISVPLTKSVLFLLFFFGLFGFHLPFTQRDIKWRKCLVYISLNYSFLFVSANFCCVTTRLTKMNSYDTLLATHEEC